MFLPLGRIEWERVLGFAGRESYPKGLSHTAYGRMIPASLWEPPSPRYACSGGSSAIL